MEHSVWRSCCVELVDMEDGLWESETGLCMTDPRVESLPSFRSCCRREFLRDYLFVFKHMSQNGRLEPLLFKHLSKNGDLQPYLRYRTGRVEGWEILGCDPLPHLSETALLNAERPSLRLRMQVLLFKRAVDKSRAENPFDRIATVDKLVRIHMSPNNPIGIGRLLMNSACPVSKIPDNCPTARAGEWVAQVTMFYARFQMQSTDLDRASLGTCLDPTPGPASCSKDKSCDPGWGKQLWDCFVSLIRARGCRGRGVPSWNQDLLFFELVFSDAAHSTGGCSTQASVRRSSLTAAHRAALGLPDGFRWKFEQSSVGVTWPGFTPAHLWLDCLLNSSWEDEQGNGAPNDHLVLHTDQFGLLARWYLAHSPTDSSHPAPQIECQPLLAMFFSVALKDEGSRLTRLLGMDDPVGFPTVFSSVANTINHYVLRGAPKHSIPLLADAWLSILTRVHWNIRAIVLNSPVTQKLVFALCRHQAPSFRWLTENVREREPFALSLNNNTAGQAGDLSEESWQALLEADDAKIEAYLGGSLDVLLTAHTFRCGGARAKVAVRMACRPGVPFGLRARVVEWTLREVPRLVHKSKGKEDLLTSFHMRGLASLIQNDPSILFDRRFRSGETGQTVLIHLAAQRNLHKLCEKVMQTSQYAQWNGPKGEYRWQLSNARWGSEPEKSRFERRLRRVRETAEAQRGPVQRRTTSDQVSQEVSHPHEPASDGGKPAQE